MPEGMRPFAKSWWRWISDVPAPTLLPFDEPPCKECAFWKPHRKVNEKGEAMGIRCCIADEMHHDFSCFKEREE
jgi:hypothetical protein